MGNCYPLSKGNHSTNFVTLKDIVQLGKRNYLPLEKGGAIQIPFTQGCFVPSLVEIGIVVLEKKMKMSKVYDNTNDNRQILMRKAQSGGIVFTLKLH